MQREAPTIDPTFRAIAELFLMLMTAVYFQLRKRDCRQLRIGKRIIDVDVHSKWITPVLVLYGPHRCCHSRFA